MSQMRLLLVPGFFAILVGFVLILRSVRYAYESLGVSSNAAILSADREAGSVCRMYGARGGAPEGKRKRSRCAVSPHLLLAGQVSIAASRLRAIMVQPFSLAIACERDTQSATCSLSLRSPVFAHRA
jgi:hypothetical protein